MDNENREEDKIKKYPKSKNKLQCMGPCYEPYTWITHPITLEYITNDVPFCPVNDKLYDKKTGKQELIKTDECYNPIKNNNSVINNDVLIPYIDLDCGLFLRKYYGIYTHEELVDWLIKNNNKTLRTRNRVVECGWKAYGLELDIIDQRITEFYLELIKKRWIYRIVENINDLIIIKNKEIYFGTNDNPDNEKMTEKINFVIEKFITFDEIYKFLIRYLKYRKEIWENINNHTNKILNDLTDYIRNKILVTLKS